MTLGDLTSADENPHHLSSYTHPSRRPSTVTLQLTDREREEREGGPRAAHSALTTTTSSHGHNRGSGSHTMGMLNVKKQEILHRIIADYLVHQQHPYTALTPVLFCIDLQTLKASNLGVQNESLFGFFANFPTGSDKEVCSTLSDAWHTKLSHFLPPSSSVLSTAL